MAILADPRGRIEQMHCERAASHGFARVESIGDLTRAYKKAREVVLAAPVWGLDHFTFREARQALLARGALRVTSSLIPLICSSL